MNFWERITGTDMTKEMRSFAARAAKLPAEYQSAWNEITTHLWSYADLTGRNLMPILGGALELLEEAATDGRDVAGVLGDDVEGFCAALASEEGARSLRDKWRAQLTTPSRKNSTNWEEPSMSLQDIIEGKKEWRAHMVRVKALPEDYQIVYKELQKYLFKVGPAEPGEGIGLLSGIVDLFEEGAAAHKGVLDVTGNDVAAFADALIADAQTAADANQDYVNQRVQEAVRKQATPPTSQKPTL